MVSTIPSVLATLLPPYRKIKDITDRHKHNDGEVRCRLGIHAGDGFALLTDQRFILRGSTETANQSVDLAAPQQRVQTRRNDAGTASAKLELILVLAEDVPGFDSWIAGAETDGIVHIAQVLHSRQDRQALGGLSSIVGRERIVNVLSHVQDDGAAARAPAQKDVVLAVFLACFLGRLRNDLIRQAGA